MYIRQPGDTGERNFTSFNPPKPMNPSQSQEKWVNSEASCAARLDHDHAGQERTPGDVDRHPELVVADVLIANDLVGSDVHIHDAVQVLHVPALGIDLADGFLIHGNGVQVDVGDVKQQLRGHEGRSVRGFPYRFADKDTPGDGSFAIRLPRLH